MVPITDGALVAQEVHGSVTLWRAHRDMRPDTCSRIACVGARGDRSPGYRPGRADETEKRKAPLATRMSATVAIGLLVILVIGIAVL